MYWWQGTNELHQGSFVGESIAALEPEDVIGNPQGPDLDAYMARRFGGLI